jgi:hypothetical protein
LFPCPATLSQARSKYYQGGSLWWSGRVAGTHAVRPGSGPHRRRRRRVDRPSVCPVTSSLCAMQLAVAAVSGTQDDETTSRAVVFSLPVRVMPTALHTFLLSYIIDEWMPCLTLSITRPEYYYCQVETRAGCSCSGQVSAAKPAIANRHLHPWCRRRKRLERVGKPPPKLPWAPVHHPPTRHQLL